MNSALHACLSVRVCAPGAHGAPYSGTNVIRNFTHHIPHARNNLSVMSNLLATAADMSLLLRMCFPLFYVLTARAIGARLPSR